MEKTRRKKSYLVCIVAILLAMLLSAICLNGLVIANPVMAETRTMESANYGSTSIEEQCQEMTKTELDYNNLNYLNFTTIIPLDLFHQTGTFGYVGKEYGFLIDVIIVNSYPNDFRTANIMLFDVEYELDNSTNTINYSLTPKVNFYSNYSMDATVIYALEQFSGILYMGNITIAPEFNTVNQLSEKDVKYDIANDNSIYVDCIVTNHKLFESEELANLKALTSFAFDQINGIFQTIYFGGIPVYDILKATCEDNSSIALNNGFEYNAQSYEEQVNRDNLQTNASVFLGSDKLLGKNKEQDSYLTFSVKYDNKLHSSEDFQVGMKMGFDVFERIGEGFFKKGSKDQMLAYDNYNVYNNFKGEAQVFELKSDEIQKTPLTINEIFYGNKFLNNGEVINLIFKSPSSRKYNFNATEGGILDVTTKLFSKDETVSIHYDMGADVYGEVLINSNNKLNLGQNFIYQDMSYFDWVCDVTNSYKFKFDNSNNNITAYITDSYGNIINNTASGNEITYVFARNNRYRIYINSPTSQNIDLNKILSDKPTDNILLNVGEKYYFSYNAEFNNFFALETNSSISKIYNGLGNEITTDSIFMNKNDRFYIELGGISQGQVNYKIILPFTQAYLGVNNTLLNGINDFIKFVPEQSLVHKFSDNEAKFDVYTTSGILQKNVFELYLEKGKEYYFVDLYDQSNIKVEYKINNIIPNTNYTAKANTLYKLNLSEYGLYDFANRNIIKIYDNYGKLIEYNNGYRLYPSIVYLIASQDTNLLLNEQKTSVRVNLDHGYDQNVVIADTYYAYPYNFETPIRPGYKFNGWKFNGTLVTNQTGMGLGLWEHSGTVTVVADWTVKELFVTVNNSGEVKWVTNSGLTSNSSTATIPSFDVFNAIIKNLLDLVYTDEIKSEGHWKEIKFIENIENIDTYVAKFEIVWHAEEYKLLFNAGKEQYSLTVKYGETFDASRILAFQNDPNYYFTCWRNELYGIDYNFIDSQNETAPDFTKGAESSIVNEIVLDIKRVGKTVNLTFEVTKLNCEGILFKKETVLVEVKAGEVYLLNNLITNTGFKVVSGNATNCFYDTTSDVENPTIIVENINNPKVNIELKAIRYEIIFNFEGYNYELYGNSVEFVKYYDATNAKIKLPSAMQLRKNHTGWIVFGTTYKSDDTIIISPENFGNLELKPIFGDDIKIINNGGRMELKSSVDNYYNCITLDLTGASNEVTIKVYDGIEHFILKNDGGLINNIYISIESSIEVSVDLISCNFIGRPYTLTMTNPVDCANVIYSYNTPKINIYLKGNNILKQAEIERNEFNSLSGALQTASADIYTLESGAKLSLYGGSGNGTRVGGDGFEGGSGWVGIITYHTEININADVTVYSGNGTNGKIGDSYKKADSGVTPQRGGDGGKGGSSGFGMLTVATVKVGVGYKLQGYSGTTGRGGNGGNGAGGYDAEWFGPIAVAGADGGNGGNGGIGSVAIGVDKAKCSGNILNQNGNTGYGGTGGAGGAGGKPLMGAQKPSGKRGTDGVTNWGSSYASNNRSASNNSIYDNILQTANNMKDKLFFYNLYN